MTVARTHPLVVVPVTIKLSAPRSVRKLRRGVPEKTLGLCLRMTMSLGSGAISATISLPLEAPLGAGEDSVVRLFFQAQEPASQESGLRVPVE